MSNALLKCQFGFIDPNNYALIKLNDNFDSLNYTTLNETFATQLPIKQSSQLNLFAKCIDQRGLEGVFTQTVNIQVKESGQLYDANVVREIKLSLGEIQESDPVLSLSKIIMEGEKLQEFKTLVEDELLQDLNRILANSIANLNEEDLTLPEKDCLSSLMQSIATEYNKYFREDQTLFQTSSKAILNLIGVQADPNQTSIDLRTENITEYNSIDEKIFKNIMGSITNLLSTFESTDQNSEQLASQLFSSISTASNQYSGNLIPDAGAQLFWNTQFTFAQQKLSLSNFQQNGFSIDLQGSNQYYETKFTIPYDQAYANSDFTLIKVFTVDNSILPSQDNSTWFTSKISIIQMEQCYDEVQMSDSFSLKSLTVRNLSALIEIDFTLEDISPDNEERNQQCHYYDETLQDWVILEDGTVRISDEIIKCQSDHASIFAVRNVPTVHQRVSFMSSFLIIAFILFDTIVILLVVAGFLFDKYRFLHLGKDELLDFDMDPFEQDGQPGKLRPFIEFIENDNSVCKFYMAGVYIYSRILGGFFKSHSQNITRPLKTLVNTCQFHLLLAVTGACTVIPKLSNVFVSFVISFVVMRVEQIMINSLINGNWRWLKKRFVRVSILFAISLVVIIGVHIGLIVGLQGDRVIKERQANEWAALFLVGFFFESILWDIVLQPLIIIGLFRLGVQTRINVFRSMLYKKEDRCGSQTEQEGEHDLVHKSQIIDQLSLFN